MVAFSWKTKLHIRRLGNRLLKTRNLLILVPLWAGGWQASAFANQPGLDDWLDTELLPFLEDRLGHHPRLKGQPFEIVAMKDNDPLGEMDGLTAYIRQRSIDKLQSVPGANLVFRPSVKPWSHHRQLYDVPCHVGDEASVRVGIEIGESWMTGKLRIAVQAIDLVENNWVRGFKKVWTGKPTAREKELVTRRFTDQHLLGSRALPFRDNQPDLLASYLAKNLSCLLQDRGETDLRVFRQGTPLGQPFYFKTSLELLDHYLAGFREVKATRNRQDANVVLTTKVLPVNKNLYQVWAGLQGRGEQVHVSDLDTQAYVYLDKARKRDVAHTQGSLIGAFQLIAPVDQGYCTHVDPWTDGEMILTQQTRLPNGGCFALRYQAAKPAILYLFGQTENGKVTQLLPDQCHALGLGLSLRQGKVWEDQRIHVPLFKNQKRGYFRLDSEPGVEWLYAVAVADTDTEAKLLKRVNHVETLCNPRRHGDRDSIQGFRATLTALAEASRGKLQWEARSFTHSAR